MLHRATDLEILNPELEIVADTGKLEISLTIGRGPGYTLAELNRGPETTIGVIPIDSIFSPVRHVAYEVESVRVGQRTDYDKLRLDVTTDGSVDPEDAISEAARILISQLAISSDLDSIPGYSDTAAEAAVEATVSHGMENFRPAKWRFRSFCWTFASLVGCGDPGRLASGRVALPLLRLPSIEPEEIRSARDRRRFLGEVSGFRGRSRWVPSVPSPYNPVLAPGGVSRRPLLLNR